MQGTFTPLHFFICHIIKKTEGRGGSVYVIILHFILICVSDLAVCLLIKKDEELNKAYQSNKIKAMNTVIVTNIFCIVAAIFIKQTYFVTMLCFAAVQTISDELTAKVYSFLSQFFIVISVVLYLFSSFNLDSLFLCIGAIAVLSFLSFIKAYAWGDVECVIPFLFICATEGYNALVVLFILLFVACGTMTAEYIIIRKIKNHTLKKVPLKEVPFVKNIFIGMFVVIMLTIQN